MSGHNQYLRDKYSKILLEKLREQEVLKEISEQEMRVIHSTISSYFGSLPDSERIKKSMKKIVEDIVKNEGDE